MTPPPLFSNSNVQSWVGPLVVGYVHRRPGHHIYILGEQHSLQQADIPLGHHVLDALFQDNHVHRPIVYAEFGARALNNSLMFFAMQPELSKYKDRTITPLQRLEMEYGIRATTGQSMPFELIACNCRFQTPLELFYLLWNPSLLADSLQYFYGEPMTNMSVQSRLTYAANAMAHAFYIHITTTQGLINFLTGILLGENHPTWFMGIVTQVYNLSLPPNPFPVLTQSVQKEDAPYFERYKGWVRKQLNALSGNGVFEHWREWMTRQPRTLGANTPIFMGALTMIFQDAYMILTYSLNRAKSRVHVFLVGNMHVDALMGFFGHRARVRSMWARRVGNLGIDMREPPTEWMGTVHAKELHKQVLAMKGGAPITVRSEVRNGYDRYWQTMVEKGVRL